MKTLKWFSSLSFLFMLFNFADINSQTIDNYVILDPHQYPYPVPGRTMGGATVALPDSVPLVFANPAGLGKLHQFKSFISLNTYRGNLEVAYPESAGLKSYRWKDIFSAGTFTVSLPLHLFHHSTTLAASYNGTVPYDYEAGEDYFSRETVFNSRLRTATVGFGTHFFSTYSIGAGWTHWFGKRTWRAENHETDAVDESRSHYSGDLFHVGIQKEMSRKIAIGTVIFFPFQLSINQKDVYRDRGYRHENKYQKYQKFSGAFQIGFAYSITSSLKFGFGYGYQPKFSVAIPSGANAGQFSYSRKSSITGGIEYNLHCKRMTFPVYLIYKTTWLPEIKNDQMSGLSSENYYPQFEKNPRSHSIALGGDIRLRYFTVYLVSQWTYTGNYRKFPSALT